MAGKNKDPRPSWDEYFMEIANVVAKRSNCCRRSVGAVVVRDHHFLSAGYNGTPKKVRNETSKPVSGSEPKQTPSMPSAVLPRRSMTSEP